MTVKIFFNYSGLLRKHEIYQNSKYIWKSNSSKNIANIHISHYLKLKWYVTKIWRHGSQWFSLLMSDVNPREEIWDLLAKKYSQYWWNQVKLAALFISRIQKSSHIYLYFYFPGLRSFTRAETCWDSCLNILIPYHSGFSWCDLSKIRKELTKWSYDYFTTKKKRRQSGIIWEDDPTQKPT